MASGVFGSNRVWQSSGRRAVTVREGGVFFFGCCCLFFVVVKEIQTTEQNKKLENRPEKQGSERGT